MGRIPDPYDASNNLIGGVSRLEWYADRLDGIVQTLKDSSKESDQKKVISKVKAAFENE